MSEEKKLLDTEETDNSKGIVVNTDTEGEQDVELLPLDSSEEADNEKESN